MQVIIKVAVVLAVLQTMNAVVTATPAELGLDREIWITARTDGKSGSGTPSDPFDGSTQVKFDAIMNTLYAKDKRHVTIHLGVGAFQTLGSYVGAGQDSTPGWVADDGWKILGAGMGNTILKLAGFTYLDPAPIDVAVAEGIWTTKSANWYQVGQGIKLIGGEGVTSLTLGTLYYVSEVVDAKRFKVSSTLGGSTITQAKVMSGGRFQRIGKDAGNTVITNRPWNKQDIEIKDLTIDCNWTGFGTTSATPFTVPASMEMATVDVESSAWAQVNKRVYLQQTDYRVVGVYEVAAISGPKRIVLRNLANPRLGNPAPGQPDSRFLDNLPAGSLVPAGTRICPRINLAGIGVSAARCRIERVRVTNTGAPIYEGNCGISVVGIGTPGPGWPAVSEVVVRDCIVDNIWGQHGWPLQIHGNNVEFPSKGYGTQALVEGNTIYGNGLHQGLGGWNYINSFWINNKVVNCQSAFFTDTPNCWNNVIKNNLFLDCKSYTVVLGGGCAAWKPETRFKPGDATLWNNVFYLCKAGHANHAPPDAGYWDEMPYQAHTGWNSYVFEGNVFEISNQSGPLLFNGNVANAIFRNNILRYADGHGKGSHGLEFSNPTNRGLIVTGNVIDSRLKNNVGRNIVFGKDNVDEQGRVRRELEFGEKGR